VLPPKSVIGKGYGGHSETERVLVIDDGLTNLKWLKIQSGSLRKIREKSGVDLLIAIRLYYKFILYFYEMNFNKKLI
jgi:hypothetical protein